MVTGVLYLLGWIIMVAVMWHWTLKRAGEFDDRG